jgi:hypothetical protein
MKKIFETYLEKINLPDPFRERVHKIVAFYSDICLKQVDDIYVSEYVRDNGQQEYESLWLFTKFSILEARDFIIKDDFDYSLAGTGICYWRLKKEYYELKESTSQSRLYLKIDWASNVMSGELKGSGLNCEFLKDIFIKYAIK